MKYSAQVICYVNMNIAKAKFNIQSEESLKKYVETHIKDTNPGINFDNWVFIPITGETRVEPLPVQQSSSFVISPQAQAAPLFPQYTTSGDNHIPV